MGSINLGRHHVAISDQWTIYTPGLPGWQMLGVITRSKGGEQITKALARSPKGELCAVRGLSAEPLVQRKAEAALAAAMREAHPVETDGTHSEGNRA
jgi:hypothetical protein